jgi:hypothetical protein
MSATDSSHGARKDGCNWLPKLLSLGELSLGGAIFMVSLLGLIFHFLGEPVSLAADIFAACFGATATFIFLSTKLHLFK